MTLIKLIKWKLRGSPRCSVCHRPLTTKRDIMRGVGAGCFKKQEKLQEEVNNG
jgi:hypothetical protein